MIYSLHLFLCTCQSDHRSRPLHYLYLCLNQHLNSNVGASYKHHQTLIFGDTHPSSATKISPNLIDNLSLSADAPDLPIATILPQFGSSRNSSFYQRGVGYRHSVRLSFFSVYSTSDTNLNKLACPLSITYDLMRQIKHVLVIPRESPDHFYSLEYHFCQLH